MNIAEASTTMSQMQVQQQVGARLLRMNMDNAEQQAQAITKMAEEAGQAAEQSGKASGASGALTIQDNQLGNRIDTSA